MPPSGRLPVIVGVGDIKNTSRDSRCAVEPLTLIVDAIRKAALDTGLSESSSHKLVQDLDCINVVQTWTWPYADLPGLVAAKIGAQPRHKYYSEIGGDKPVRLLDDVMRKIVTGVSDLAVVTGGEALASRMTVPLDAG